MLDHISLRVSDFEKGKEFYKAAFGALGYDLVREYPDYKVAGFGPQEAPMVWVSADGQKPVSAHIALIAESEEDVQEFYEAGIAAGGKDNGAPGLRPDYGDNYYAAFVLDPDGNNIEAVYRG